MPNCPICGTEIKEGAGFCPRCWRRLVTGEAPKEKNKKKLAAIIIPCVIAVAVAVVLATHLLPLPSGHVAEIEYAGISAYNLGGKLFNPRLTPLQSQDVWKDYEGKQVQWTSELEYVSTEAGKLTAHFLNPLDVARTEIAAVFDESEKSSLLELSEGDLVTYTGILAGFGPTEISLTDCTGVSPALVRLWWDNNVSTLDKRVLVGDNVVCLGPDTYDGATQGTNRVLPRITALDKATGEVLWQDEQTGSILVGVDSDYVYAWHPLKIVPMSGSDNYWYWYASDVTTLNQTSGQIGWDYYLSGDTRCESQINCLPGGWTLSDYVGCCILQSAVKQEIDKSQADLTFLIDKAPLSELSYEYHGVIYESACAVYGGEGTECGALQAVDKNTGDVLWTMTFQDEGMNDFSIVDGILYVSTDKGFGAFQL
jgi:outer membrane protein assembly factor BamB/predicted nucleic acid-binding Zn ribbon protein